MMDQKPKGRVLLTVLNIIIAVLALVLVGLIVTAVLRITLTPVPGRPDISAAPVSSSTPPVQTSQLPVTDANVRSDRTDALSADQKSLLDALEQALSGTREDRVQAMEAWSNAVMDHSAFDSWTDIWMLTYQNGQLWRDFTGSGVLINGSSVYFGTIDHQTPDGEGMAIVVDGKASGSAVMYFLQEGTWDQGVLTGESQLIRGSSQTDPSAEGCVIQCTLDGSADEIMTQAQLTVSQTQNGVTHQFTLQAENGAYSSDGTDLISCALHSDCGVSLLVDGSVTDLTYQNPYPWGKQPRQMGLPFSSYAYGYGGR